jgi:hypothetical protein
MTNDPKRSNGLKVAEKTSVASEARPVSQQAAISQRPKGGDLRTVATYILSLLDHPTAHVSALDAQLLREAIAQPPAPESTGSIDATTTEESDGSAVPAGEDSEDAARSTIYIVAEGGYEGPSCFVAFTTEQAAEAHVAAIKAYCETRPVDESGNPEAPDYDEQYRYSPSKYAEFEAADRAFRAGGPAPDNYYSPHSLYVFELELRK